MAWPFCDVVKGRFLVLNEKNSPERHLESRAERERLGMARASATLSVGRMAGEENRNHGGHSRGLRMRSCQMGAGGV